MSTPLSHYLVRLGKGMPDIESFQRASEPAEKPLELRLAEAAAQGEAEGRAAALREGEARLTAARAEFGATMLAERSRWTQEESDKLARLIHEGMADLEQRIADGLAAILQPFVTAALRERAVAAVHETIATIIAHDKRAVLRISGPEDLLSSLRHRLAGTQATLDYVPGEAAEVTVIADATIIETQLEAFQQRLQQSFG